MSNTYETLFENIRAKCRQRHWFGPDFDDPHQYDGPLAYDPHFNVYTIQRIAADDLRCIGFVFPPASEDILQRDEQMFLKGAAESDDYYYLARMSITLEEWLWGWVKDDFNIVNFGKTSGPNGGHPLRNYSRERKIFTLRLGSLPRLREIRL